MSTLGPSASSSDDEDDLLAFLEGLQLGRSPNGSDGETSSSDMPAPLFTEKLTPAYFQTAIDNRDYDLALEIVGQYQEPSNILALMTALRQMDIPRSYHIRIFQAARENAFIWQTLDLSQQIIHLVNIPQSSAIEEFNRIFRSYTGQSEDFYLSLFAELEKVKNKFSSSRYPIPSLYLTLLTNELFWTDPPPKFYCNFLLSLVSHYISMTY